MTAVADQNPDLNTTQGRVFLQVLTRPDRVQGVQVFAGTNDVFSLTSERAQRKGTLRVLALTPTATSQFQKLQSPP